jgi:tetratricopeptide (TPR) repeat protein
VTPGNRAQAEALFAQAFAAQKAGAQSQALSTYRNAVAADPSHFPAQFNRGVAAFDSAAWPEALQAFEAATRIKPEDESARLNLALSLERANYPADAAAELETLLTAKPGNLGAHLQAAGLYAQKLGDTARARLHYQRVLELDPAHLQAPAIRQWLNATR